MTAPVPRSPSTTMSMCETIGASARAIAIASSSVCARSMMVRTVVGSRDAVGARVRATAGGRTQVRVVRAGSSYLGQNDLRLHFGLEDAAAVDRLEVTWPSGRVETFTGIATNQIVTIQERRGVVGRVPFTRGRRAG